MKLQLDPVFSRAVDRQASGNPIRFMSHDSQIELRVTG